MNKELLAVGAVRRATGWTLVSLGMVLSFGLTAAVVIFGLYASYRWIDALVNDGEATKWFLLGLAAVPVGGLVVSLFALLSSAGEWLLDRDAPAD